MNNFEQTTTFGEALEALSHINLTMIERSALRNILDVYTWMSANDILINATYKDIIELFLDEVDGSYLQSKEEREHIKSLLETLDKKNNN